MFTQEMGEIDGRFQNVKGLTEHKEETKKLLEI